MRPNASSSDGVSGICMLRLCAPFRLDTDVVSPGFVIGALGALSINFSDGRGGQDRLLR